MALLLVKNLTARGTHGLVLKSVSFSQRKLERVAVVGETGAGKSTLMRAIAGLVQPEEGEVVFERQRVRGPGERLVPGHPGIAYLSQHFELQKSLRVEQVLDYANTLSDEQAESLFRLCQIDHLLDRRTDQLSGGEKQRVAISRLLISAPRLLLLDEPFSHLDREHKDTLKAIVEDLGDQLGITLMLVSHDQYDTLPWADRILVMRHGEIVQQGAPEEIYQRPVDEYTGGLFGHYNVIPPERFALIAPLVSEKKLRAMAEGRSLFFRPEQWRVVGKRNKAIRCRVKKVSFMGSHWDAQVRTGKMDFHLRSGEPLREGQTCYVAFRDDDFWFI